MSGKARVSLLSLIVIVVLIFSAIGPTIVYADGETPADPTTTETTSAPDATSTSTEATTEATATPEEVSTEATSVPTEVTAEATSTPDEASTETATSTDVTAEATSVPTEATADTAVSTDDAASTQTSDSSGEAATSQSTEEAAPTTEDATATVDSNVLNEVPDDTTVTVLDANGESQPLATQDAANAIATTSDPIWCPGTQAPTPGANGCTDSFSSFDALLTFLSGNATYQGAGTIYVQQGAYTGGESSIDFNAYNLSNISNADLTVTGGWNTASGTVDPATTSSFNDIPILIGSSANPWGGSLTISNLSLSFNPTGSVQGSGLTLSSQNNITLSNVSVTNSPNGAGAELNASGDVTISDSKFDRNKTAGAIIRSGRNVTIANSSFSNPANGRRQITGLDIVSTGATSLFNVIANGNREVGANINSGGPVAISSSFFSGTKIIQGTNFLGYGLQVVTPSSIAIDSVTANNNFLWGASLQAGGDIAISNSIFNGNTTASPGFMDDTGLVIHGGGNVALNNVQANDNRLYGAVIDATGTVSINNSTFSNNRGVLTSGGVSTFHGHGLQVTSLASIFLNNVTATNNMLFGAQLNAAGEVAIANSTFSNTSTGSSTDVLGKGLDVVSTGNTSLFNVVLDNNQTVGANIQAGTDVFLDTVTATNNGSDGVALQGICTHLSGGNYSGNGQYGLNLGNSALDLVTSPTFANNGVGDIFPATPATCALVFGSGSATSSAGSSNIFASLQVTSQKNTSSVVGSSSASSSGNMSLDTFLSFAKVANGGNSIFMGKYAYIYSSAGMQIVAFSASLDAIAMHGAYRAY